MKYYLGSTFSTCRVDGPQCCSPLIIQLFTRSISSFINTDTFSFTTGGLANAEEAIDLLRNETSGEYYVVYQILPAQQICIMHKAQI